MSTLPWQSVVIATGSFLPARVVTNEELTTFIDTSDEWIKTRSGIEKRHFAADGEFTSDLAVNAALDALNSYNIDPNSLDAIIVATATPDKTFPSTASMVQNRIGMKGGFAFDIAAVCAGFIYALANADALIRSGQAKRVMVIGAETFSRIMDWNDRTTSVLFGDGAGAVILEGQHSNRGVLSTDLHSDGSYHDLLYVDGGVSTTGYSGKLRMQGKEVFKHAVTKLAETAESALEKAGLASTDIDWIVPHQANLRIIKATADKMNISMDQVILTVQDHGNTSAASIPLALAHGVKSGQIRENHVLAIEAIGGGLVWGAAILRW